MTTPHRPDLPQHAAEILLKTLKRPRSSVAYGSPLLDVVAGTAPWRDWLEEAVLAGYLPHLEGIEIAIRGYHVSTANEVEECERLDVSGDAIGWVQSIADHYRELILLLEEFAIELDRTALRLHREPYKEAVDATTVALTAAATAECETAIRRAHQRIASLNKGRSLIRREGAQRLAKPSERPEVAARIDPEEATVFFLYADTLDPYGDYDLALSECQGVGREFFAAGLDGIAVSFCDLPDPTRAALEPKRRTADREGWRAIFEVLETADRPESLDSGDEEWVAE